MQSTKAQNLDGLDGVKFPEFERSGTISRSHYLAASPVIDHLGTALLGLITLATLLKLVTPRISNIASSRSKLG